MKQKIIVDTSIWIDYFKGGFIEEGMIENGLNEGYICITGPVISELLQGVKTQKEYNMLSMCIDAVPFLECCYEDWINAGEMSFQLRKKGITVPLTDVIIAAVAKKNGAKVYTLDKHFIQIPGVELY